MNPGFLTPVVLWSHRNERHETTRNLDVKVVSYEY